MTPIRIILADDHSLIREGFKAILGQSDRVEIVGEAQNGLELIEMVSNTRPDVILTDLSMPRSNGFESMEEIRKDQPDMKFIILTMHEEREYILRAIKAGASGYLLKNTERAELEHAIVTVHEGGKYFSPSINNILAEAVLKSDGGEVGELTAREKEVLELVASGFSTKQIADKLRISIRTVESHRINMLKKMKVNNSAELIRKAVDMKLL